MNLVLIPSVTRNPLLSEFLSEEMRLNQLCRSIESVLEKIPNSYIVVLEGGTENTEDDEILLSKGANNIFHYDLEKNEKRLKDPHRSKSYGEMTLFIEFFKTSLFKELRPNIKSISKLGGRAYLNDSFVFDDSENCFIRWTEISWRKLQSCSQRYWKIPSSKIDHLITQFNEMRFFFKEVPDIEHGFYRFNVVPIEGLEPDMEEGVTHFVSSYGKWENT